MASSRSLKLITGYEKPVDASRPPHDLTGFRTMFSSFHHFDPQDARAMLADSFDRDEGIAIFEAAERRPLSVCVIFFVPLLSLVLAPKIRPFCWSRLFWTYLVPVIPFVLWIDGILSCLRCYSLADMAELTAGLDSERYSWQLGQDGEGILQITDRPRPDDSASLRSNLFLKRKLAVCLANLVFTRSPGTRRGGGLVGMTA
jgi:hypothetical protein